MARMSRSYTNQALTGSDFANQDLKKFDFCNSALTGCDFTNTSIINCDFTNATLTGCDLANANFSKCAGLELNHLNLSNGSLQHRSGVVRRGQVVFNNSHSFDSNGISIGNVSFQSQSFLAGTLSAQSSLDFGWLHCDGVRSNEVQQVAQFGHYDGVINSRVVALRFSNCWLVCAESIGGLKVRLSARSAESEETGNFWEVVLEHDESVEVFGMTVANQIGE